MKNEKNIKKLANKIIELEKNIQYFHQNENTQEYAHKIEKIMESLPPEKLFQLIEVIEKKIKED